jgi:phosphatidylserine decarboxylase
MAHRRWGLITTSFIRWFVRHYGVNLSEATHPQASDYANFGAFFARALRTDARSWPTSETVVASPVDGVTSRAARLTDTTLIQAKGIDYSLGTLLASSAHPYADGHFATLYLRPQDYHRVHAPLAGRLTHIRHIPGRLWPVRPWAVAGVAGLFAQNERVVLEFSAPTGPYALIMVGALMVGSMETVVTGSIGGNRHQPSVWNLEATQREFSRGEEIGRFNFGSTVILVFGVNALEWDNAALTPGREVRLGQPIGMLKP